MLGRLGANIGVMHFAPFYSKSNESSEPTLEPIRQPVARNR